MASPTPPPLDDCGFVRVPTSDTKALWMTCERCGKSDHFWVDGDVHCRCGATWSHAVRPDGSQIPAADLTFVPFESGPMQLADLTWDPVRVAMAIVLLLSLIALGVIGTLWAMGLAG